jgi:hypothetical protein
MSFGRVKHFRRHRIRCGKAKIRFGMSNLIFHSRGKGWQGKQPALRATPCTGQPVDRGRIPWRWSGNFNQNWSKSKVPNNNHDARWRRAARAARQIEVR